MSQRPDRYPTVTFRARLSFLRLPMGLVESFSSAPIADLSDAVGRLYTMDSSIRPLYPDAPRLLGSAVTVKCPAGDNFGVKSALRLIEPGDVLVIDGQGFTDWCLGGFRMLEEAIADRGLRGVIVNGAYRDAEQCSAARFAVYAKAISPWSGPKRGPAEINVPVACGGVIVEPGDVVVADQDGAVVVPRLFATAVLRRIQSPEISYSAATDLERDRQFWAEFEARGGVMIDPQQ
ncbi:regulator of RNase E activity RraA [Aminobacter niigataensis]|uniref:Putative 4-hydroxy-4-methyl-2-oxoglutarate aldolase n=1 Tax=Aminobacter niigataensis TaxID=83265 RepID=A0ABR6L1I6_9HYPH|nr:hypothetical protein [Aminobacter niigataensis]MBB4650605.1 regulator of RNase E activity RraA [Aminobacter niigataensis]